MEMRDVVGYEGLYTVSEDGRVWSLKTRRWLKPSFDKVGYLKTSLYKNGIAKTKTIHRIVCEAFHGLGEKGLQVDHINGIKSDNRAENLRWVTQKENWENAFEQGVNFRQPIIGFNERGETIRFNSINEAFEAGFGSVFNSRKDTYATSLGYVFVNEDDFMELLCSTFFKYRELLHHERLSEASSKKKGQGRKPLSFPLVGYDRKTGKMCFFDSPKQAKDAGYTSVLRCLRDEQKTCGGKVWCALGEYKPQTYRTAKRLREGDRNVR